MTSRKSQRPPRRPTVRAACDRCHETKSRCARAMGSLECERCNRLGNVCTYSAPLPMGRPKEKEIPSSSSPKEYEDDCVNENRTKRKRHKRAAQRTSDSVQFENENQIATSSSSSASSVTNVTFPVVPVEDSQRSIFDPWLPTAGPSGGFDLNYMMQSTVNCTSPPNNSISFPTNTLNQFHNTSLGIFPAPHTMDASTSGIWDIPSNTINSSDDLADESQRERSRSPIDTNDGCLYQLLKLQSDLYEINSRALVPDSSSQPLSENSVSPGSSPHLEKVGTSSLDIIFGTTQTLIDILRVSLSSSLPVPQSQDYSTPTSQGGGQGYSRSTTAGAKTSKGNHGNGLDPVTTLLIVASYSSLLVAYDRLVESLVQSPSNLSDKPTAQVPPLSPSLNFGTFSMTAKSTLTFQTRVPLSSNTRPDVVPPLSENIHPTSQNTETSGSSEISSPVISAAKAVLAEIAEKEERLMEVLATKR